MHVCLIIPAAGRSTRFGSSDKLAQDLGGRPLLVRTIEAFAKREEVKHIIVAGPPDEFDSFKARYGPVLSFHGAVLVEGSRRDRWETVKHALAAVPNEATHIAVHDAARPGVSNDLLNRIFEAARTLAAVVPAVNIHGTVKRVESQAVDVTEAEDAAVDLILGDAGRVEIKARRVVDTLDRTGLVEVQTPQVFEAALLRRAYDLPGLSGATDDASVVERLGEPVHVIEGDQRNLKITTSGDLVLMRAILGVSAPKERPTHLRF